MDYTQQIKDFYKNFNIDLDITNIIESYSVTRYFVELDRTNKTRIANVERLVDDLAVELNIKNIKFTIDYETGKIVLEIPNRHRKPLDFKDISYTIQETKGLTVCLGKGLNNNNYKINLCDTPHLLVAGTTGSGKSVFINSIICQLISNYSKNELELSLIDPKKVELSIYKNVEHVTDIATDLQSATTVLQNAIKQVEQRYKLLEENNTRNIENYNKKAYNKLPYKLIIIDELADILLQDKKNRKRTINNEMTLEGYIVRIAQIGRACGVHLIVATQRPSSDVITGLIKANIPSRVAFSVSSKVDSRIILDDKGAEKLTGKGDLLFKMVGNEEITRIQSPFISDEEVESIVNQHNRPHKTQMPEELQKRFEQEKKQQHQKVKKDRTKLYKTLVSIFFVFVNPITIILYLVIWGYFAFAVPTFEENKNLGYGQFDSVYVDENGNKIPKDQVRNYFQNKNNN